MSYLQLLVNLRSETALARVINVPDRGLDHRAFTAIKKESKKTKLSMYQVNVVTLAYRWKYISIGTHFEQCSVKIQVDIPKQTKMLFI